ncbi:MAG: TrkH family potassium uptake protein [Phototrophicales bacterium]
MRYRLYLIDRYRSLIGYTGVLLAIIGVVFIVPLLTLVFYPQEVRYAPAFLSAGLPLIIIGMALWYKLAPKQEGSFSPTIHEGMVVVLVVWVVAVTIGAVPFMLISDLTFTQGAFESISGWTTTGLSVVDVESAPRVVLLYRSLIQLAGGAGFAIIALSALAGPAGAGLSAAEGRGDQLAPHVRHSAAIVLRIYAAYNVIGIVALRLAGMTWFDAVNHTFTALATGGFSTRAASIGYFNNPLIEAIVIVLMLLGALNFLTAYTLFRGNFRAFRRNGEIRLQVALFLIVIPLLLVLTTAAIYDNIDTSLRVAVFESVSALSGTGFTTVGYANWNSFGLFMLVILMTIGGGSGSTAGGIKLNRVYVMVKAIRWEWRRAFLPQHTVNEPSIWEGENRSFISDQLIRRVTLYVFFYIAVLFIGTAMIAAHGYSIGDSLFEFASSLGTTGLSVGVTTPDAPPTLLWGMSLGMFLARLEFFAVMIGVTKLFVDGRVLLTKPETPDRTVKVREDQA